MELLEKDLKESRFKTPNKMEGHTESCDSHQKIFKNTFLA